MFPLQILTVLRGNVIKNIVIKKDLNLGMKLVYPLNIENVIGALFIMSLTIPTYLLYF